jgi:hypothetical protein
MLVAIAERVDSDAGGEIEIGGAILREQSHALAPRKGEFGPGIRAIERRHWIFSLLVE